MTSILFLSNGIGEDTIAASVVRALLDTRPDLRIYALPLVGEGINYTGLAEVLGPRRMMPSGGLIPAGIENFFMDLRSGLVGLTLAQIAALRAMRAKVEIGVPVGDAFPVIMGGLFLRRPLVFVGTAKSNWFCPYSPIEKRIFRRFCKMVFPRDEPTAQSLRDSGVPAEWAGNAMMDSLTFTGGPLGVPQDRTAIGILPGSRKEAYADLPIILKAVEYVDSHWEKSLEFLMAPPASLSVQEMANAGAPLGWALSESFDTDVPGIAGALAKGSLRISIFHGRFGDVLQRSHIIIGQAGTGNEQAAGLGKPVVAFDSAGRARPGWYRARQKGLLGRSLSVVTKDPSAIGGEVLTLLEDPAKYEGMRAAGYERMGPPGAARRMADYIIETLDREASRCGFKHSAS